MTDILNHTEGLARNVFAGLVPTSVGASPRTGERTRQARNAFATGSILLVGSIAAMTLNLSGPVEAAEARPTMTPRGSASELGRTIREAIAAANSAIKSTAASLSRAAAAPAPVTYSVAAGDTISSIAGQFGLSTASVLALNGLGWSSLIFPGQVLTLGIPVPTVVEAPVEVAPTVKYTIVAGDTIGSIAERFGVPTAIVLSANGLGASSLIFPDQSLTIPSGIAPAAPIEPELAVDLASHSAPLGGGGSYTIVSGDTVGGIAATHAISEQSLLDANGLQPSSLIFSGDTLTLPASAAVSAAIATTAVGSVVTLMDAEMRANATVIVQVGHELGVSSRGIVIALATAMQESSLRNLQWGDRDSVGLFQQRPSTGWGSVQQLTTPDYASRLFFGGPTNPNAGVTRGLLDVSGWESMPLTVAAQEVQTSAFPTAYAQWEASALLWYSELD